MRKGWTIGIEGGVEDYEKDTLHIPRAFYTLFYSGDNQVRRTAKKVSRYVHGIEGTDENELTVGDTDAFGSLKAKRCAQAVCDLKNVVRDREKATDYLNTTEATLHEDEVDMI